MHRDQLSSQGVDVREREAKLLAAELLMPQLMLADNWKQIRLVEISDDNAIIDLARRYGVSAQALVIRLINLGFISQP